MKAQLYPASKIKVGATLYAFNMYTDDETGTTTLDCNEHVIRSIKRKRGSCSDSLSRYRGERKTKAQLAEIPQYVNLVERYSYTMNGVHFKEKIPAWCRHQFEVGDDLPFSMYTTKLQAIKYCVAECQESVDYYADGFNEYVKVHDETTSNLWKQEQAVAIKELRLAKSRLTKIQRQMK